MKKTLILLLLTTLFLSCASTNGYRKKYDMWYPGKAQQRGKEKCGIFPKPIFKN